MEHPARAHEPIGAYVRSFPGEAEVRTRRDELAGNRGLRTTHAIDRGLQHHRCPVTTTELTEVILGGAERRPAVAALARGANSPLRVEAPVAQPPGPAASAVCARGRTSGCWTAPVF